MFVVGEYKLVTVGRDMMAPLQNHDSSAYHDVGSHQKTHTDIDLSTHTGHCVDKVYIHVRCHIL